MPGRLLAVSDLHIGYPENRAYAESLAPGHPDDWLIVAGDVGESFADVGFVLAPENVSDRLESAGVNTQIFAGGQPHERPIGPYGDWATNAHLRLGAPAYPSPPAVGFTARN